MTSGVVAVLAPSFTVAWLWLSALCLAAAWLAFARTHKRLLPPRPEPDDVAGALRADTPAVVNLLTNDATVTASGFRATMIDLARAVGCASCRPRTTSKNSPGCAPQQRPITATHCAPTSASSSSTSSPGSRPTVPSRRGILPSTSVDPGGADSVDWCSTMRCSPDSSGAAGVCRTSSCPGRSGR